ncbi:MAG: ASCH domain-containing protein [candidate division SR1 bacterium]|nr:ASCH domain-containing protein [candidate division SR1 bacterium]
MKTTFNVQEPYRSQLLTGEKSIEGRLNKGKFSNLMPGDKIELENTGQIFLVERIAHYKNFQTMLQQEDITKIIPGISEIQEGVAIYHQFYTPVQEKEYGVLAIHLKKEE